MDLEEFIQRNAERALQTIDAADVLVVGFTMFPERLLADFRSTEEQPPVIKVVQPVESAAERLAEIQRLRPALQLPERLFFFIWPRRLATFEKYGIWTRIVERCLESGHGSVAGQCNRALDDLRRLERRETRGAIKGGKYRSLWERGT